MSINATTQRSVLQSLQARQPSAPQAKLEQQASAITGALEAEGLNFDPGDPAVARTLARFGFSEGSLSAAAQRDLAQSSGQRSGTLKLLASLTKSTATLSSNKLSLSLSELPAGLVDKASASAVRFGGMAKPKVLGASLERAQFEGRDEEVIWLQIQDQADPSKNESRAYLATQHAHNPPNRQIGYNGELVSIGVPGSTKTEASAASHSNRPSLDALPLGLIDVATEAAERFGKMDDPMVIGARLEQSRFEGSDEDILWVDIQDQAEPSKTESRAYLATQYNHNPPYRQIGYNGQLKSIAGPGGHTQLGHVVSTYVEPKPEPSSEKQSALPLDDVNPKMLQRASNFARHYGEMSEPEITGARLQKAQYKGREVDIIWLDIQDQAKPEKTESRAYFAERQAIKPTLFQVGYNGEFM